jgi:hypothetical protein
MLRVVRGARSWQCAGPARCEGEPHTTGAYHRCIPPVHTTGAYHRYSVTWVWLLQGEARPAARGRSRAPHPAHRPRRPAATARRTPPPATAPAPRPANARNVKLRSLQRPRCHIAVGPGPQRSLRKSRTHVTSCRLGCRSKLPAPGGGWYRWGRGGPCGCFEQPGPGP